MKTLIFSLLLFSMPQAFADFDRPVFKNSQMLEDSDIVEDEKIKLNCFLYRRYIILEREEPGYLGKIIYFKENSIDKNAPPEAYCKDLKINTFKKLDSSGANFYGIYKKYLFVQDPDELSARTKFEVYNLQSGLMTYSGIKNNDTMLKIVPVSSTIAALEYYQRYQVDCDFNSDKMRLRCWNEFLASAKVPEQVKIPYPDCPKTKTDKKYQVFLKVQVPNIQNTRRRFLWSKPLCEIAP